MESADSESLTLPPTGRVGEFRCAAAARARAESLAGTAPQVNGFLLLEEPGPWGIKAWRDARLPEGFGLELQQRCAAVNLKALLIRRGTGERGTGERGIVGERSTRERGTGERGTGERGSVGERRISERGPGGPRRVFVASTLSPNGFVETTTVRDSRELLDLDLAALAAGRSPGLTPTHEPLFAVCTHGKHDACCAERGRPVLAAMESIAMESTAMESVAPQSVWGVSHLGGHRFAAMMLVLDPAVVGSGGGGLYYGGLDPESVRKVAAAHRAGHLDLDQLRGRTSVTMPIQAAEIGLRRHLGHTTHGGVRLVEAIAHRHPGGEDAATVTFAIAAPSSPASAPNAPADRHPGGEEAATVTFAIAAPSSPESAGNAPADATDAPANAGIAAADAGSGAEVRWQVEVRSRHTGAERVSCSSEDREPLTTWRCDAIRPAPAIPS